MAKRYRKIDPRTWKDEGFVALGAIEKYIAIYLITGQSNRIGLFQFSFGEAYEDLGLQPETFAKGFGKVILTLRWRYDERLHVVYIPTWWKYNLPENPNVLKSCLEDLHDIPNTQLIQEFAENTVYLPESFIPTFNKGLPKPSPKPCRKQEQEQEQEQEQKQEGSAEKFTLINTTPFRGVEGGVGEKIETPSASQPTPPVDAPKKPPRKRDPVTPVTTFELSDEDLVWAAKKNFTIEEIDDETESMVDHFRGVGECRADWHATWRNWMKRSREIHARRSNGRYESDAERKQRRTGEALRAAAREISADIDRKFNGGVPGSDQPGNHEDVLRSPLQISARAAETGDHEDS